MITAVDLPDSSIDADLDRLREHARLHQFNELLIGADALLSLGHDDRRITVLKALALRGLNQINEALVLLREVIQQHPRFSRAYAECGHCYVAKREASEAIHHYRKAVELNPALPGIWEQLAGLYKMTQQTDLSQEAQHQAFVIRQMPEAVVIASGLFADGDLKRAEQITRDFILKHGDHFEAMRLLARIGAALEIYDDAELLLREVVKRVPDYHAARQDLAAVLLDRHKYEEAEQELLKLIQVFPNSPQYRTLRAAAVVGLGQHEKAIELYQQVLQEQSLDKSAAAEIDLSIAHSYKTIGNSTEAITHYRRAIAKRPDFGDAYWSLANLKTYRFTDEEMIALESQVQRQNLHVEDHIHLHFALAKGHEDHKHYDQAWTNYSEGNRLKRLNSKYRPELLELNTRNQKMVCQRAFFEQRRGYGVSTRSPIFILGLPRSGSTLLEQILASHSEVEGTQELANIPRLVIELQGRDPDLNNPRYPHVLSELPRDFFTEQAEHYLRDTAIYRSGKAHFIDKMPNNFRHIGLIHLMFPHAAIIDARREPMACCFGNFKQLFARGQEFSYSIEDIARYYRTYIELMEHWENVLPGRVLRVHHEDVVEDLEGSVRRLLDYCQLPFESSCLEFHKTNRSVRTASSEQVRQPIYKEGMDQWRHFEPWLVELKALLGDALIRYRS
jgi:tetratricopeptide (TPR) repeat protein